DTRVLEPVQPEAEFSTSPTSSTPEPPVSLGDPESMSSVHPSIVSDVNGSCERTDANKEPELLQLAPVLLPEAPSQAEEPQSFSSETPSSFMVDPPAPPKSDPIAPARESEPASTNQRELPVTEFHSVAAPPLPPALSDAPSVSPALLDTSTEWSTV